MFAATFELIKFLVKEKHISVNTALLIVVVVLAVANGYIAREGARHAAATDTHLDRVDKHLEHEDTDIVLMKQALSDHGVRLVQPRLRDEDMDSNAPKSNNYVSIQAMQDEDQN